MQKHRMYTGNSKWHDANLVLSQTTIDYISSIGDLIGSLDPSNFACSYLKEEYLSKCCDDSIVSSETRRAAAIQKWLDQEIKNKETNYNFLFRLPDYNILPFVTWRKFLKVARRIVYQVLGPLTNEIVIGSFSGGASTSRRRTVSSSAKKFVGKVDITEQAEYVIDVLHRECPLLRQYNTFTTLNRVEGAVLFTVPKKSEIDRCACKEPDINMYFQKGVGRHIRHRLRKFGIDLNDQSRNRGLALQGSLTNSLATIDLSSASDSITIECVRALLPDDWFEYLNSIRSQSVNVDGNTITTEMFSSMGNGFTFELESLIFYSIVRAASYVLGIPGIISVYGDDIICSSELYPSLEFLLPAFGFAVNGKKSYHDSPFRESCGGHYYSGIDVTPFYLKRPASRLTDLIRVANQLRSWILADVFRQYEIDVYPIWEKLKSLVPEDLWGGYDTAQDTILVCPGSPRMRLCRTSSRKAEPPLGSYLQWHNSNWNRSNSTEVELSFAQDTNQRCRKRRAPRDHRCQRQFYQELA